MLVAERGVEYHRLGYQAKIDYWQEVEVMIIIIMMIFTIGMTHDDADVEDSPWLQVGGKPSRWPQVLVTLAYAEKVGDPQSIWVFIMICFFMITIATTMGNL